MRSRSRSPRGMEIFVENLLDRSIITLDVEASDSIEKVKGTLHMRNEVARILPDVVAASDLRLIFAGKQFEDGHTLADYHIPEWGQILRLSLRDGTYSETMESNNVFLYPSTWSPRQELPRTLRPGAYGSAEEPSREPEEASPEKRPEGPGWSS